MKNKKILMGLIILLFIGIVNGCLINPVYEDDFNDNVVDYNYWTNLSTDGILTETGGRMCFNTKITNWAYGKYLGNIANSDIFSDVHLYYGYHPYNPYPKGKATFNITDGKWGIECETANVLTYDLKCKPINNNATSLCNNYIFQTQTGYANLVVKIKNNQINFTYGSIFIQCNNSFQQDSEHIEMFFASDKEHTSAVGYINFYDFTHGNRTNYHKLTWNTLDYYTHEPIKDLNITITHVQNSNYPPIPQNCLTNSYGKCIFLFDYFCNMSCDEVIMIEADLIDIYDRTPSIAYNFFGIGRDEYGDHSIITYHIMNMSSHDIEFIIQDYSFQPIYNASVELEHAGIVKYCYTNSSGKCKIQAINDVVYTATIKKYQYKTKSDIIILTSMMPYDINRTYYLSTKYVNEVDLLISGWNMTGNATGLNDSEIKLSYISGYSEYIGFSWIPVFNNSIANVYGLPKGTYEITVNDIEDYCILEWGIPVESKIVTLNLPNEYLGIFIKYCDYKYNFTGNVFTSFTWDDWNNHIYNASVSAEIMLYNDKHNYIDYTDSNGFFNFSGVSKGVYTLHIRHDNVHQEYFESINIDENIHKNYYIIPDLPPTMKNVTIYGYVLYNDTFLGNVDIYFNFNGWEYITYTNLLGFYNFTGEVPTTNPYYVNIEYNQENYPEYVTAYRRLLIDKNHLEYQENVTLTEKSIYWNVYGDFVDKDGNKVYLTWKMNNYSRNNIDYLTLLLLDPNKYTVKLSGLIIPQEIILDLPNNYTIWAQKKGDWNLNDIIVTPVTHFIKLKFIIHDNESNYIENAVINLKNLNSSYYDKTFSTNVFGETEFLGIPALFWYEIKIEKTNYETKNIKFFAVYSKTLSIKLESTKISIEESIDKMINEWALILVGLIMCVIFLFFGSMLFEFLDKIGGK